MQVLTKDRTVCEKIMSLVRFSHTKEPYKDLSSKIRHIYDIHIMLQDMEVSLFFNSQEFDQMMALVANDDQRSFRNNNSWLFTHPKEALIFKSPNLTWERIRAPYRGAFKDLVIGNLPEEDELVETLMRISKRLAAMKWDPIQWS